MQFSILKSIAPYLYLIIAGFILMSCSADKQTGEQSISAPGVETSAQDKQDRGEEDTVETEIILKISPETAFRGSSFRAFTETTSLDDKRIDWFINGEPVAVDSGTTFSHENLNKSDIVYAVAVINSREILSNSVIIRNSLPVIKSVSVGSDDSGKEKSLGVDVEWSDNDNDDVSITFEWTINGESGGSGEKIEGEFKRGDRLEIRVIPFDGEESGDAVYLTRIIENMPPKINEDLSYDFDGKIYTYQVLADDPDNDALTYSLSTENEGIEIDTASGLITWNVPDDFIGDVPLTVNVSDDHGGKSTRELTFSIKEEKEEEKTEEKDKKGE